METGPKTRFGSQANPRHTRMRVGVGVLVIDSTGRIVTYPGDDYSVHLVDVILAARIVGGSLQCSAESLELRFFAPQELPADIVPPAVAPVQDFVHGRSAVIS